MPLNIFNCILITLVGISTILLFPSLISRWYYIEIIDNNTNVVNKFSFYASRIVHNDIEYKWEEFNLSKVHEILRASLAFTVIPFVFGVFSLFSVTRHFNKIIYKNKMISIPARIMVIAMFIFTIVAISIIPGGISRAFKEDFENSNININNSTSSTSSSNDSTLIKPFNYCMQNGCDEKWRGESNENGIQVKYGPGICWFIVAVSLIPQFLSLPFAIYAFFAFQYYH